LRGGGVIKFQKQELYKLTDSDLAKAAELHVATYRGVSQSTRLLEELLERFTKQRNILDNLP
jgi:hypothetical protein